MAVSYSADERDHIDQVLGLAEDHFLNVRSLLKVNVKKEYVQEHLEEVIEALKHIEGRLK